ncbi:M15 family metallopeptidase [Knoellia sp. CPCC 206453]|uniref:M15 family metallopeptidase n=1 Tax=Knoellia pratensis TaxID=3404796 RepID=UPI00361AF51B
MTYSDAARTVDTRRRTGLIRAGVVLAALAVMAAGLGHHLLRSSPSTSAAPLIVSPSRSSVSAPSPRISRGVQQPAGLGATGEVPDGVTVFNDRVAAVTKLDPDLLAALRRAAKDAEAHGQALVVNSGWRSPEYQERLLRDAIAQHGSKKEAARWVATPKTSAHVAGEAVDLGPSASAAWLSRNGARYGLCQIYRNEPWHFELRPDAVEHGCPRMYADPTKDPRMQG